MATVGTALGAGECGATRVGEEVEEVEWLLALWRFACEALGDPVPHAAGFKHAEVPEVGGGEFHFDAVDARVPGVGQTVAAAPLEAVLACEKGVGLFPEAWLFRAPNGLCAWAVEGDLAEALQFAAVAAVE